MKRTIRNGSFSWAVMAVLPLLVGCGGGGATSSASPAAITTIYSGHWIGGWNDAAGDAGTMDVTVGADGRFTGTIVNTAVDMAGAATGKVTSDGHLIGTYTYPGAAVVQVTGTVAVGQNGQLSGNVQETRNGQPLSSGGFVLTRQ